MDSPQKLTKYYVFFSLLVAFTIGALVYTISQASNAKIDKTTVDKVNEIATKLQNFTTSNNQAPGTLDDAGVNNVPSTIIYTKIDDRQYKLCVSYKDAASSFGAGWLSLLTGALASVRGSPATSTSVTNDYLDTYSLTIVHKKGQNCQTVKSPGLSSGFSDSSGQITPSSNLVAAKCGNTGAGFELKDQTTIQSVDSGQGSLTLDTTNAKLTDKNSSPVKSLASINYDSLTAIYRASDCKKLATSDVDMLKPGAAVTVYLYSHDTTYADQLEL